MFNNRCKSYGKSAKYSHQGEMGETDIEFWFVSKRKKAGKSGSINFNYIRRIYLCTFMYLCLQLRTYMHAYIHTYRYTYIHTYTFMCVQLHNFMKSTHTSPKDEKPKLKIIIFFYFHQPHINPHFMFFFVGILGSFHIWQFGRGVFRGGDTKGLLPRHPPHPTFFCDSYSFIIYQIMSPPSNGRSVGLS